MIIPHPEFDRLALIADLEANAKPTGNYAEAGFLDRHAPPVGDWLLHALRDAVQEHTGSYPLHGRDPGEIYPRNCYGRIVTHGAELIEHVDRGDLDFVVSVNVLRDVASYLELNVGDKWLAFNDAHGAILNRGNRTPHRRLPYAGQRAFQLILNYTLTPPAEADRFVIVEKLLAPPDIERIRTGKGEMRPAELGGGKEDANERISNISWLDDAREWAWLRRLLAGAVYEANASIWNADISGGIDGIQFTRYGSGGFYNWHEDRGSTDGSIAKRALSIVVLLREPESGGGLELENGGVMPLKVGDAVVFPSEERHRALAVEEGERETLVAWVLNR